MGSGDMSQNDEDLARENWARMSADHIVDGALAASERAKGSHPTADQVALMRAIARRALWHMPNSSDEVRDLARHLYLENLRQPHPRDDDPPPNEPPWA